jgi:hypothetical protein
MYRISVGMHNRDVSISWHSNQPTPRPLLHSPHHSGHLGGGMGALVSCTIEQEENYRITAFENKDETEGRWYC